MANVVCEIAHLYYTKALDEDLKELNQHIYKWSLTETLYKYCKENLKCHGHLIALKQLLVKYLIDDEHKLNYNELALFQLKDFCWNDINRYDVFMQDPRSIEITIEEAVKAMDYRQSQMVFPYAQYMYAGRDNIDRYIDRIREALLKRSDIVSPENQPEFTFFVENNIQRKILDTLSG